MHGCGDTPTVYMQDILWEPWTKRGVARNTCSQRCAAMWAPAESTPNQCRLNKTPLPPAIAAAFPLISHNSLSALDTPLLHRLVRL